MKKDNQKMIHVETRRQAMCITICNIIIYLITMQSVLGADYINYRAVRR